MTAPLRLTEHGEPTLAMLDASGAQALVAEGDRWRKRLRLRERPIVVEPAGRAWSVSARGVLGVASVDDLRVDITPKFVDPSHGPDIWGPAIWHWIAYAGGMDMRGIWTHGDTHDAGIADLMAEAYMTALRNGIGHGLPVRYTSRRAESRYLSGRLEAGRIVDPTALSGRLPVVERSLTRRTPEARLLRWAAETLASVVHAPSRRVRLLDFARKFPAQPVVADLQVDTQRAARQFPRLVPALELAQMLLSGRQVGPSGSKVRLPGFLCKSEEVFEEALRRLVREAGRSLGLSVAKESITLAKGIADEGDKSPPDIITEPDLCVRIADGPYVVMLDAKYRVPGGSPKSSEAYQVLAAGRVAGTRSVGLVYPFWGHGITEKTYSVVGAGFPHRIHSIGLGMRAFEGPKELRSLIDELALRLKAWLEDVEADT